LTKRRQFLKRRIDKEKKILKKGLKEINHGDLQDAFIPLKSLKDNGLLSLQLLIEINQQEQFVFQIKLSYPYVRGSCVYA